MPTDLDSSGRLVDIASGGTRRYASGTRVAIATASGLSVALDCDEVLLHPTVKCYVLAVPGGGGTVTSSSGIPLEIGEKFHMQVERGQKLAVIRDTTDGFINIVPVL